jgi:hypothetical protein
MNCVASSCQPDAQVPPMSERQSESLPPSVRREVAIRYLRAASRSADVRKRESLRRRAADLILPRSR